MKIISNGEAGAGITALELARQYGLETGGVAPYNWVTLNGYCKSQLQGLHLTDGHCTRYPAHMEEYADNVDLCDAMVFFGIPVGNQYNWNIDRCRSLHKPYIVNPSAELLVTFIESKRIETLYVSGSDPVEYKEISSFVKEVLTEVFNKIKEGEKVNG